MSTPEDDARITELEIRSTHQEAALQELTDAMLAQQQRIEELAAQVEELRAMLRELAPSPVAPASEETPPPHY